MAYLDDPEPDPSPAPVRAKRQNPVRRMAAEFTAGAITFFARLITAVRVDWRDNDPTTPRRRIYFANHNSHGDFILIWAALPPRMRALTRPVAGSDYWGGTGIKGFVGSDVFNAVLIDRDPANRTADPVAIMADALDAGGSLIMFPEGTRNLTDAKLLPFRSGLFHLARARPDVDLVPVWIENLNRVMPKGEIIPVPIMCKVTIGPAMWLERDEDKDDFLTRTRDALLDLAPQPLDDTAEGGA